MAEITHADLETMAVRLETSFRRDVDGLRDDVCDRIEQVRGDLEKQGTRLEATDQIARSAKEDARVARHDITAHISTHETFRELVDAGVVKSESAAGAALDKPHGKAFVAGVTATILALAGIGHGAWDMLQAYLPELMKRWRP